MTGAHRSGWLEERLMRQAARMRQAMVEALGAQDVAARVVGDAVHIAAPGLSARYMTDLALREAAEGQAMSAELAVRDAVIAALKADEALMDGINALFDGPPERASAPYLVVGECIATAWGAGQVEGCELRLSISLHASGGAPGRLAPMLGRIDPVLQQLDGVADGWRVVTARLLRSRIAKIAAQGQPGWQAAIDYRIRAVRAGLKARPRRKAQVGRARQAPG